MMALNPVWREDTPMQRCARCGTPNDEQALACSSCGAVLVPADEASVDAAAVDEASVEPAARDPYAELSTLGAAEASASGWTQATPAALERTHEPAAPEREPRRTAVQTQRTIPEWVLPAPPAPVRDTRAQIPAGRGVRFVLLLVAWIGLFHALPLFTIWSTSPGLQEAIRSGVYDDYLSPPSCPDAADALGQDAALCSDPNFAQSFERATAALRSERNRVLAFLGLTWGMLAIAFLVLVMGAGLRGWWWFAILVAPLAWFVEGWAMWRLSAFPVRYWEKR